MTITTTATSSGPYTATGQTTFAVTFQSAGVGELQVLLNGTVVSPTLYTHSRNADGTGSVVFTTPQTGTILINSVPSFTQGISFAKYGAFYPDQINPALDRAAARSLYLQALLSRSILSPVGETPGVLPSAAARANGLLGFDGSGNIIPYAVPAGGVAPSLTAGTLAGRGSASGAGFYEGITVGSGLNLTNKVLSLAAGGLSVFTPEGYGAVGDGTTNDTTAFQTLTAAVQAAGGGVISLSPGKTYILGGQTFGAAQTSGRFTKYTGVPQILCEFLNLTKPIIILGNGAKIKIASGLKYGTFDASGVAMATTAPYYLDGISIGYDSVFLFDGCTTLVHIENLEIDGSGNTVIGGGEWGDTGRQLGGTGIKFMNNRALIEIDGYWGHHHTSDGLDLDGYVTTEAGNNMHAFVHNYRLENNGRLGCAIVGARGISFQNGQHHDNGRLISSTVASFTGSISGSVLTVSAVASGVIALKHIVSGTGVPLNLTIVSQATGPTGGVGTYNLSATLTTAVASEAMTSAVYISSAPASGVDHEAEGGKVNRDITYKNVSFQGSLNTQVVADSGTNTRHVDFDNCRFVATIAGSTAIYLNRPYIRVRNSVIAGQITSAWINAAQPGENLSLQDNYHTNDNTFSPTGLTACANLLLIDVPNAAGMRIYRHTFDFARIGNNGSFGGGANAPDLVDCTIIARSDPGGAGGVYPAVYGNLYGKTELLESGNGSIQATPRGGRTDGGNPSAYPFRFKVDSGPSYGPWAYTTAGVRTVYPATTDHYLKDVIFNVPYTWAPGALAAGASQSTTFNVPGAVVGGSVAVTINQPLQSSFLTGEVTAAGVVTVTQTARGATGAITSGPVNIKVTNP